MSKESRDQLIMLLRSLEEIDYVHPEDIPNIDLYVDQVTTFIDSRLESVKRNPEDKTLTKTMINNYTKNHVLPSPDKKKYSRDHVLSLIIIYYLKSFLSISDIQSIMNPITERYFGTDSEMSFFDVYSELVKLENKETSSLVKDIIKKYHTAHETFSDAPEEDQEFLQNFAFICTLAFDVYIKKMMIEELVDAMPKNQNELEPSEDKKTEDSKKTK